MKKIVALFVAVSIFMLSGCYGKFNLTRKVYNINGSVDNKFLRSAVTWAFIIIPVYGIAALLDFILFNTIEFWTGSNPIAEGEKEFFYAHKDELFYIKAKKDKNMVTYKIRHYREDKLVDTLDISWDLKDGISKGVLNKNGEISRYLANKDGLVN